MRSRYSHNLLLQGDVVIDRQTPPKLSQSKQWGLIDWTNATGNVEAVLATQITRFNYQRKFVYNSPFKLSITDVMSKLENNEVDTYQLVFHLQAIKKLQLTTIIVSRLNLVMLFYLCICITLAISLILKF